MDGRDFKLPTTLAEYSSPRFREEMLRAEKLLNALQNLKVVITIEGRTTSANGVIQISGDSAIILVEL